MSKLQPVLMENAKVVFRNFKGREGLYNREGDRNFCVILDPGVAEAMNADGWNIKTLKPRDGNEVGDDYIQVSVGFRGRPPRIVMITSRGRTDVPEDLVEILDWVDLANVDLIINPYEWNVSGNSGVKAYLKSIFVTVREDALELKYADVPEVKAIDSSEMLAITAGDNSDIIDVEEVG